MIWKGGWLPTQLEAELNMYQKAILGWCVSGETSSEPENWSEDDLSRGQCVPLAILIQDLYGGEILRASLENVPGYEKMKSHYWNRIGIGQQVDLTRGQFKGNAYDLIPEGSPISRDGNPITKDSLLKNPDVKRRYEILLPRFLKMRKLFDLAYTLFHHEREEKLD